MTTLACGHCGAELAFEGMRALTCPYCASGNVVERPAGTHVEPRFVVAFACNADGARAAIERWIGSRSWFADSAIRRARVEDLRGVYVPAYLYSAVAHTSYSAQIGEHYTETVEVEVDDGPPPHIGLPLEVKPRRTKRTEQRTVTRTEYRPLTGTHVGYVTDVVVSASAGLRDDELARLEPFDLRQLRRFSPAVVAGWIAEEFARPLDACQRASREAALDEVGEDVRRFMPGDSHSDLAWRSTVTWEAMDPVLVPAWVLAVRYRDDRPPLRVVINGQTGKIAGKVPLAWWKIGVALATVAAIALAVWMVLR